MSDTTGQPEPTMEEILASIRRIISEDDPGEGEQDVAEAATPAEPVAEAPIEEPQPEPESAPEPEPEPMPEPEPQPEPEPAQEEDVLELTQKVEEDGTVVDLAAERAAAEPAPNPLTDVARSAVSAFKSDLPIGGGRTLEDVAREVLTVELKAWLDGNLGPLVEEIVRDEIKKKMIQGAK